MKEIKTNWRKGKTYSEIYKNDYSKVGFRKGKLNPIHKKEVRDKIRKAMIGWKPSKESIEKRAKQLRGKTYEQIMGKTKAMKLRRLRRLTNKEKSGAWLGGITNRIRDKRYNEKFKKLIRKRDNQICMVCRTHREKLRKALDVHHIDYNKLNTIPSNCIALCHSCHQKTNYNRRYWFNFFKDLMSNRYDYIYPEFKVIKFKDKEVKYEVKMDAPCSNNYEEESKTAFE